MDGIPPTLIPPIVTGIVAVLTVLVTQYGSNKIQQQRRYEARETREIEIGDRAAERTSKEAEMLRTDLKERVATLERKVEDLASQNEDCKRREMTLQWKLNMVEFQATQLRDENNRLRAERGEPPLSPPPPGPADPFPRPEPPPYRPPDVVEPPTKDQSPPTTGGSTPPTRPPPRH